MTREQVTHGTTRGRVRRNGGAEQFHGQDNGGDGSIGGAGQHADESQCGKGGGIHPQAMGQGRPQGSPVKTEGKKNAPTAAEVQRHAGGYGLDCKGVPGKVVALERLRNRRPAQAEVVSDKRKVTAMRINPPITPVSTEEVLVKIASRFPSPIISTKINDATPNVTPANPTLRKKGIFNDGTDGDTGERYAIPKFAAT